MQIQKVWFKQYLMAQRPVDVDIEMNDENGRAKAGNEAGHGT